MSEASKLEDAIAAFFKPEKPHTEGGKEVTVDSLVNMRQEIVGIGSFSRVRLANVNKFLDHLKTFEKEGITTSNEGATARFGVFALKVYKKTEAKRLKLASHIKAEVDILSSIKHPFIVNLYLRWQDEKNLYLLEEFAECGQLHRFITKNGRLPNETARFHAAQIVMAVQCLHGESVVFRDLQPENIMLDHTGYVKLVDFGNAKRMDFDDPTARAWTLCGRPEYLAPEMVKSLGHGKEVDWWALGVILHEMLAGYPPFYHADSFAIYKLILQEKITAEGLPNHFETFAKDLIKKLMTRDKTKRIGSSKNGAEDIKKHKWYRGLNWAALYNRAMAPPVPVSESGEAGFVPKLDEGNFAVNFEFYPPSNEEAGPILDPNDDKELFGDF